MCAPAAPPAARRRDKTGSPGAAARCQADAACVHTVRWCNHGCNCIRTVRSSDTIRGRTCNMPSTLDLSASWTCDRGFRYEEFSPGVRASTRRDDLASRGPARGARQGRGRGRGPRGPCARSYCNLRCEYICQNNHAFWFAAGSQCYSPRSSGYRYGPAPVVRENCELKIPLTHDRRRRQVQRRVASKMGPTRMATCRRRLPLPRCSFSFFASSSSWSSSMITATAGSPPRQLPPPRPPRTCPSLLRALARGAPWRWCRRAAHRL